MMSLQEDTLPFYFLACRYAFVVLFTAFCVALIKLRRPVLLAAGALVFCLFAWLAITAPLQRLWSLAPGHDRMFNLAMYATAATGHSAFESWQIGAPDLEPFWRWVMRAVSGGDPTRTLTIYHYLPALVLILLPLSFTFALAPATKRGTEREQALWELGLVIYAVLLFNSSPLERYGVFQTFWQMNFLLKPNHAAAFALIPWVVRAWMSDRPRARLLAGGVVLTLLAWVFLLQWGYVLVGLSVYVLWAAWRRESKEVALTAGAIVLSCAGALPYFVHLVRHFGWQETNAAVVQIWNKPGYEAGFLDVFSVSLEHGAVFFLAVVGLVGMTRRRSRQDVLWCSLAAGCVPLWLLQFPLFYLERAGEPDEIYFFTRFLLTVAAGKGAYFALQAFLALKHGELRPVGAQSVAGLLVVTLPLSFPYWWNPPTMDRYFAVALDPIPTEVVELTSWIRQDTSPDAVFLAESDLSLWIAALSGRRVFLNRQRPPADLVARRELERRLLMNPSREVVDALLERYHVTHVVLDDPFLEQLGVSSSELEGYAWLVPVHRVGGERVYRLVSKPGPRSEREPRRGG